MLNNYKFIFSDYDRSLKYSDLQTKEAVNDDIYSQLPAEDIRARVKRSPKTV